MTRFLPTLILALTLGTALPSGAASPTDDGLRLVPPGAAAAGVLRIADLRSSPLAPRLFGEMDEVTLDGDAAAFLAEAGLRPVEDVDVVVFAAVPGPDGPRSRVLAAFEGRFEPARLAAAVAARGATAKASPSGAYFLLPEKETHGPAQAVAFASPHLIVAGTEAAVLEALTSRLSGGTVFPGPGSSLGPAFSRVDSRATGWVVIDRTRFPEVPVKVSSGDSGNAAGAIVGAMNQVSALVFQATAKGDALQLGVVGLVKDEETSGLLEDALRGLLAGFRLAAQDKPEVVSLLRRFKVTSDAQSVSIGGTLPVEAVKALAESHSKRHAESGPHPSHK